MLEAVDMLKKAVVEAESNQTGRLHEKTETLKTNIVYYGGKTQELIEAIVQRRPYDPETGLKNTVANTVKSLGIDADNIRFNKETEEFEKF